MIARVESRQWSDWQRYSELVKQRSRAFARRHRTCSLSIDDMMQEAWIAVSEASQNLWRVDETKHDRYLARAIRYRLLRLHQKNPAWNTIAVLDATPVATEEPLKLTPEMMAALRPDQRRLLKIHLGLNGRKPVSLQVLSQRWGVSDRTLQRRLRGCRSRLSRFVIDLDH